MTHTSTPWHVDDDWDDTVTILAHRADAEWLGQKGVWPVCYIDRDSDDVEQADIDAAFIVTAVNAHAGLLEVAAKAHYEAMRKKVSGRPAWDKIDPNDAYDMGMKSHAYQAALAAALETPANPIEEVANVQR